jgi:energy-coupling factor transporter ATP-binding protein EcfA2
MQNNLNASLFGVYNARHLNPNEVASTFVPQKRFWDLLGTSNNLLVGPRGSGKTTLLKMLQPAAMCAWGHEKADEARAKIGFVGVFVPTDLNWTEEINVAVQALRQEEKDTLTEALFVANVQGALINTLGQLIEGNGSVSRCATYTPISKEQEVKIVSALEELWNFSPSEVRVPSFRSFRASVLGRIRKLSSYRPNMPNINEHREQIKKTLADSQFNFENTFLEAIEAVEYVTEVRRKWGLLFDEVELADKFLQGAIFSRLRAARSEDVVYKLAVVPYVPAADILNRVNGPGISNDWTPIPLWYSEQTDAMRFCRDLWAQVAKPHGVGHLDPGKVFGRSLDREDPEHTGSRVARNGRGVRYGKNGTRQREFVSLYNKDPSFRSFLQFKGINPEKLDTLPPTIMDSVVRKIAPIVAFRNQTIARFHEGRPKLRSAKAHQRLFSGWDALCIVSEGNPRWFKAIVDSLLRERAAGGGALDRAIQYRELERASRRFRALVAACPVGEPTSLDDTTFGPLQFVETITKFQRDSLLDKEFKADMPLSIECDMDADPALLVFLSACLNVGAVISVDEEDAALSLSALRGRKFRLSYLLAPSLVLPLRTGKPRALSTIFSKTSVSKLKRLLVRGAMAPTQRSLWDA